MKVLDQGSSQSDQVSSEPPFSYVKAPPAQRDKRLLGLLVQFRREWEEARPGNENITLTAISKSQNHKIKIN